MGFVSTFRFMQQNLLAHFHQIYFRWAGYLRRTVYKLLFVQKGKLIFNKNNITSYNYFPRLQTIKIPCPLAKRISENSTLMISFMKLIPIPWFPMNITKWPKNSQMIITRSNFKEVIFFDLMILEDLIIIMSFLR